jgi:DNA polymerase-3 subunit beta
VKARIDVDQLRPAVTRAAEPAGRATGIPATASLLVHANDGHITIQGTDLDLTVTADATNAHIDQPGRVLIPARPLNQFLAKVTGAVTITADDRQVTLDAEDTTVTLRCPHVDEFPKVTYKSGTTIPDALSACVRLAPLAGTERNRPVLTGVHLSPGRIGVTDSYRGAILDVDGLDTAALIPAAAIRSVAKHVDDAAVAIDDRGATFTAPDATCEWRTRLIEGDYPDLDRLVRTDSPHHLTVDRHELADAINRVRFISENADGKGGHAVVRLQVDGGKLTITARTQDLGEAVATIGCDSDFTPEIAFNSGFLTSILDAHLEDQVRLDLVDSLKPAMTREGPLSTILMPVRVGA